MDIITIYTCVATQPASMGNYHQSVVDKRVPSHLRRWSVPNPQVPRPIKYHEDWNALYRSLKFIYQFSYSFDVLTEQYA